MWKASSHYTLWRVVHDNSANQIAAFPFLYLPSVILRILDRDLLIVLPMREPSIFRGIAVSLFRHVIGSNVEIDVVALNWVADVRNQIAAAFK